MQPFVLTSMTRRELGITPKTNPFLYFDLQLGIDDSLVVGGGFLVEGATRRKSTKLGLGIEGSLNSGIVGFRGLKFRFIPFRFGLVLKLVG